MVKKVILAALLVVSLGEAVAMSVTPAAAEVEDFSFDIEQMLFIGSAR